MKKILLLLLCIPSITLCPPKRDVRHCTCESKEAKEEMRPNTPDTEEMIDYSQQARTLTVLAKTTIAVLKTQFANAKTSLMANVIAPLLPAHLQTLEETVRTIKRNAGVVYDKLNANANCSDSLKASIKAFVAKIDQFLRMQNYIPHAAPHCARRI